MGSENLKNNKEKTELINAYIDRYSQPFSLTNEKILTRADKNFWAYEKFAELVKLEPAVAFETILATLSSTENEDVLDNLAAGPLEDLIRIHGVQFIDQIEVQAFRDKKFRNLLSGLWKVGAPDVWDRISKLQDSSG